MNNHVLSPVVDVNECATNNGGCEQVCTNLPGMYKCECNTGFVKDSANDKKCVGEQLTIVLHEPRILRQFCLCRKPS